MGGHSLAPHPSYEDNGYGHYVILMAHVKAFMRRPAGG